MNNYARDVSITCQKIREVYQQIISEKSISIYDKDLFDEVTSIDLRVEEELIQFIREYDEKANILSEEYNCTAEIKDHTWIIDPLDGTCNYSHGISMFGIQCAFYDAGETKWSVIYFPFNDEMFTAIRGTGAKLNGNEICPANRPVNRAIISFGDFTHTDKALRELEFKTMKHISAMVEKIRMYGAASIDFAYAACGRIDGNYTFVKNPWDIMPGLLLCEEAGMIITDIYGETYTTGSDTVAVFATKELCDKCMMIDIVG